MSVENSESNREKCSCPACPSFGSCMSGGGEALYCAVGATDCVVEKVGCICGGCVVFRHNELTSLYYCAVGAAD